MGCSCNKTIVKSKETKTTKTKESSKVTKPLIRGGKVIPRKNCKCNNQH